MSQLNLDRFHQPSRLSMIGGAAQGGSAKPKQEREQMDRQHEQRQEDSPSGAGGASREGTVGGNSNDSRTDQERSSGSRQG
jgi:hypothetical protein